MYPGDGCISHISIPLTFIRNNCVSLEREIIMVVAHSSCKLAARISD